MTMKQFNRDNEIRAYRINLSLYPIKSLWQINLLFKNPKWKKKYLKALWRYYTGERSLTRMASDNVTTVIIMKYLLKKYF